MRSLLFVLVLSLAAQQLFSQKLIIDNQGHSGLVHGLAFTEQGKKLVSVSEDKTVRVWDVASGTLTKTYRFEIEDGVDGRIYTSVLSKDERFLFLGGYFDHQEGNPSEIGQIRILDLEEEKLLPSLKGHQNVVLDLAISQDGKKLISSSADQSIIAWDISNMRAPVRSATITGIESIINSIDISEDGSTIAAGDQDGNLRTWSVSGGNPSRSIVHSDAIRDVKYAGNQLYSAGEDGQIIKWTKSGKFMGPLTELPGAVNALEVSADNRYLTAMGRVGIVYDLSNRTLITQFSYHTNVVSAITTAPFTTFDQEKGIYVASAGGDDKNILLWNILSGQLERNFVGKGKSVFGVGIDEAANKIAFSQSNPTGILDDVVLEKAFDLEELALDRKLNPENKYHRATQAASNKFISKESSNSIKVDGRMITTDDRKDGTVRSFTFINKGNALALGSSYSLNKYNVSGSLLGSFQGHEGEVWALADFASKDLLLSASNDQTIKIWNNITGENLASLFVASDNEWVIWTPQGFYEASAGGEKYIGWHINQGQNNLAVFHDVSAFASFYHRPDVIQEILKLKSFDKVAQMMNLSDKPEEKITPPTVTWITETNTIVEGHTTTLSFDITSPTPVHQIKILADGRPLIHQSELSISGDNRTERVDIPIELPEETDKSFAFTVFVADQNSKILSTERHVAFEYIAPEEENEPDTSSPVAATPRGEDASASNAITTLDPVPTKIKKSNLYLVSIGISEFAESHNNLNHADKDADAIDELFKGQQGKMFNNVTSIKLTNEKATRANILQKFQRLEEFTTVDDFVIIFIASHGLNENDNFYLLPYDGSTKTPRISCIDWRDFSDMIGNISARVVLFIDTCHSGQLGNNMGQHKVNNTEAVRQLSGQEYGVVIMAASTGAEYSFEHQDWGHGAFALSILEGIGEGKADVKPDGVIYLRELDYYLSERVQELTGGRQHPTTQKPSSISRLSLAEVQ
ncbi:WD40 repeat [Reichenbachiella agariperforans]|uniref:WD40 repeat n=1 Tax=Reichenbachiella agariperforans TaxID=156994 RepID=A0A1M6LUU8_REIAG|nr:caspase family protein [Reichenbachiella agariperforans]SHJ75017.1 WD40 repeat [Reichenbachiella agariperforans]